MQGVPKPTHMDILHLMNSGNPCRCLLDTIDNLRVDTIHEVLPHSHGSIFNNKEDSNGDKQTDNGVHQRETEQTNKDTEQNRQRGQTINASMLTIGNQSGRTDLISHTNAEYGDAF